MRSGTRKTALAVKSNSTPGTMTAGNKRVKDNEVETEVAGENKKLK